MELAHKNVTVQVLFPPDTDTPGFEVENLDKPEITRVLSETSGLFSAERVAKQMVHAMLQNNPSFNVSIGLDGFLLHNISGGMGPVRNISDALGQIFLSGIFRFVSLFYLWDFGRTVAKLDVDQDDKKGEVETEEDQEKEDDKTRYGSMSERK
jgi:3-dehydrosphinganine reductase